MKYLRALGLFVASEPALTVGVIVAALNLLAGYGLPVGGQHALDFKAFAETLVIVAGAFVVRSQVSPVAAPNPTPTPSPAPAPPAPPAA